MADTNEKSNDRRAEGTAGVLVLTRGGGMAEGVMLVGSVGTVVGVEAFNPPDLDSALSADSLAFFCR